MNFAQDAKAAVVSEAMLPKDIAGFFVCAAATVAMIDAAARGFATAASDANPVPDRAPMVSNDVINDR